MEDNFVALDGLSLPEAFQRFVLQDPTVMPVGQEVIRLEPSHRSVFEEGQAPGYFIDYRWPLKISSSELAFRFVSRPIYWLGDPLPKAPRIIKEAAEALCRRIEELRRVLIEGHLLATGTFTRTGAVTPIDSLQWGRETIEIDIQNGDLIEIVSNKPAVLWTGIRFFAAKRAQNKFKATKRVETIVTAKRDCTEWLIEEMLRSPNVRPAPKTQWWEAAQSKWGKRLSRRGFDGA